MSESYVEKRDNGYWVANSRVSLDSIIYAFREGMSAESIADNFPVLTREQIYGAIAYYLKHQAELDDYLKQVEADFESLKQRLRSAYPQLNQKLEEIRQKMPMVKS